MKVHTSGFKEELPKFAREIRSKVTYKQEETTVTLDDYSLNSVTPLFKGSILKSVMKQLEIDCKEDIELGTVVNYKFGLKVGNDFEYIDFGNYIVSSSERQEDTNSYKLVCYDKMLLSMVAYENLNITYPTTIRNYILKVCERLGLTLANGDSFVNSDKKIVSDPYLDVNGKDLGYTFRDVLDELAQVTASTICINSNDELEIRYVNDTNDVIDSRYLKDANVNFGEKYGPINSIVLSRSAESDNVYLRDEESVQENGLCELKICDNQIMNSNDRDQYLPGILNQLNGLTYCLNDFVSTGICYFDLCDLYQIQIDNNTYKCLMLNDELIVSSGFSENIYTDRLEESETDYKKADKTDRRINQAFLIVDKQNQTINSLTSTVQELDTRENNNYQEITNKFDGYTPKETFVTLENSVNTLQTNTYTKTEVNTKLTDGSVTKVITTGMTIDENGLTAEKTNAKTKGNFSEKGLKLESTVGGTQELLFAGYDEEKNEAIVRTPNINVGCYLTIGKNSRIEDYKDGTGVFDI